MFRVVGIAAVNGPLLMSTLFSREDIYAGMMQLRFTAFNHSRAKQLPHFRVLFKECTI
jgi:hypothetical protein